MKQENFLFVLLATLFPVAVVVGGLLIFKRTELSPGGRGIHRIGTVCIAQGDNGARTGMRNFTSCEEALKKCPVMIFPPVWSKWSDAPIFVTKGIDFPVRIVALSGQGEVLEDVVLLPRIGRVELPSSTAVVVEFPVCHKEVSP